MNIKILKRNLKNKSAIKKAIPIIILLFSFFILNIYSAQAINAKSSLTSKTLPMKLEGLDNLHKVSNRIFRSAQPTKIGMKNAETLGIGTVISLRSKQKDEKFAEGTNLNLIHVSMRAWNPRYEDAVEVMRLLNPDNVDLNKKPILIHCYHGADRTGMMIALYRIVYQNWEKEEALSEMLNGGYGYHSMWKDIVTFIKTVDVEQLRKDSRVVK
jgi:protein tyrosine/serine phosphatase